MKIRPVGADSFCLTEGQTDGHDKANSCFSKFCERAQKSFFFLNAHILATRVKIFRDNINLKCS